MAYRRRQGMTRASTFKEETLFHPRNGDDDINASNSKLRASHTFTTTSSLAAQAIRASAAHRESSLSSAYAANSIPQSFRSNKVFAAYDDHPSGRSETSGFWGVLARKAKAILDDEAISEQLDTSQAASRFQMAPDTSLGASSRSPLQGFNKMDNPALRKGLDKITSSLNHIGDTFEKAFEEGRTIVENKTSDIIQETRKLQMRRNGSGSGDSQDQLPSTNTSPWQPLVAQPTVPLNSANPETQLKASRDVAMATAAKAKLLLRELKTVKADLAFAKLRCSQLEEENKKLRESREKGGNHTDDDLIRLQLETLLAEKARLANENSVYARENRFLREIVEYHQLTMQDVVYLDEGSEEVTEVYPLTKMLSISPPSPMSPPSPSDDNISVATSNQLAAKDAHQTPTSSEEVMELLASDVHQEENKTIAANKEGNSEGISRLKEDHPELPSK